MNEADETQLKVIAKEFGDKIFNLIKEYGPQLKGPDTVGILISMATMTALKAGATPEEALNFIVDGFNVIRKEYERTQ